MPDQAGLGNALARVQARQARLNELLWEAVRQGDLDGVALALERGAQVDARCPGEAGGTALHLAAGLGLADVVAVLMDGGADVSSLTAAGMTALTLAANKGHMEVVRWFFWLFKPGAAAQQLSGAGAAALVYAARHGALQVVLRMLDLGADPSFALASGQTALWEAGVEGHQDVAKALLEYGANPLAPVRDAGRLQDDMVAQAQALPVVEQALRMVPVPARGARRPRAGRLQ